MSILSERIPHKRRRIRQLNTSTIVQLANQKIHTTSITTLPTLKPTQCNTTPTQATTVELISYLALGTSSANEAPRYLAIGCSARRCKIPRQKPGVSIVGYHRLLQQQGPERPDSEHCSIIELAPHVSSARESTAS